MADRTPTETLENALQRVQHHLEAGDRRIKAWYSDDHEAPEDFPELEKAPHQNLMERSAKLYSFAADLRKGKEVTLTGIENDVELLLYGVGMERLLTGVHLKLDPDEVIVTIDEEDQTPSFQASKNVLIADIANRIPSEQCGMLNLVLEMLWKLRNNEAHIGFHRYQPNQVRRLFLEVSCMILQLYADTEPAELEHIREIIETRREQRPPGARTVDFDLMVGR